MSSTSTSQESLGCTICFAMLHGFGSRSITAKGQQTKKKVKIDTIAEVTVKFGTVAEGVRKKMEKNIEQKKEKKINWDWQWLALNQQPLEGHAQMNKLLYYRLLGSINDCHTNLQHTFGHLSTHSWPARYLPIVSQHNGVKLMKNSCSYRNITFHDCLFWEMNIAFTNL